MRRDCLYTAGMAADTTKTFLVRPMRPDDAEEVAELSSELGYPTDAQTVENRYANLLTRPTMPCSSPGDKPDAVRGWLHRLRSVPARD